MPLLSLGCFRDKRAGWIFKCVFGFFIQLELVLLDSKDRLCLPSKTFQLITKLSLQIVL